jgi:hypothetical protein
MRDEDHGSTPASSTCFNCGAALTGLFCPHCGQKSLPLHPRIADFLHELAHETLHVDGRIFSSFSRLLRNPGFLTREYFEGRRARWVSPIRLYLIFSVLYFAIASFSPPSAMRVKVTGDSSQEEAAALQTIGPARPCGVVRDRRTRSRHRGVAAANGRQGDLACCGDLRVCLFPLCALESLRSHDAESVIASGDRPADLRRHNSARHYRLLFVLILGRGLIR